MRLTQCVNLATQPIAGIWYRAIQFRFWNSLLATTHTATYPGRFNAGTPNRPGFEILYFAEDHHVALFEVDALLGSPYSPSPLIPNPNMAWIIINVTIQLSRVVDLTQRSDQQRINTTIQELTGDWRGYGFRPVHPALTTPYWSNVPTQRLGQALHDVPDLEGFLTYSAKVPTRRNLVVFPQKLQVGNFVRFHNPATGQVMTIP